MRRGGSASIVANPVLVGAVTTLIVIVAVFLAYNANNGLPFVPTRQFTAQVTNGSNLVKGNEVREGGFRVGVITDLKPITLADGRTVAEMKLKLDKTIGDVPADSTLKVRPRSALGLKYLEFERGKSKRLLADGDTIPLKQTSVPVQFDDVYKLFDEKTREASRRNLDGFGSAFTGRGPNLNVAISHLPELFGNLEPVMRTLGDPETGIDRFFKELGDAARIVAPVADVNARLFTDVATTFEAFSRDPNALKETISQSPPTLDASIRSFRVQRPFLTDTAAFSRDLRVAVRELRGALPIVNPALETGTPVLRRSVELNDRTREVLATLRDLARAPGTNMALRGLVATVTTLNPTLRFVGPYVTVCNYWNYFWTYLAEHLSEPDNTGTSQRVIIASAPDQNNSPGDLHNAEAPNGEGYRNDPENREEGGDPVFIHGQPNGAAIDSQGRADCEANRGYIDGPLAKLAPKTSLTGKPAYAVVDPHTPGLQGSTYTGRQRVPEGQTFTANPETGLTFPRELQQP